MKQLKLILLFYTAVIAIMMIHIIRHDKTVVERPKVEVWVHRDTTLVDYREMYAPDAVIFKLPNEFTVSIKVASYDFYEPVNKEE